MDQCVIEGTWSRVVLAEPPDPSNAPVWQWERESPSSSAAELVWMSSGFMESKVRIEEGCRVLARFAEELNLQQLLLKDDTSLALGINRRTVCVWELRAGLVVASQVEFEG